MQNSYKAYTAGKVRPYHAVHQRHSYRPSQQTYVAKRPAKPKLPIYKLHKMRYYAYSKHTAPMAVGNAPSGMMQPNNRIGLYFRLVDLISVLKRKVNRALRFLGFKSALWK